MPELHPENLVLIGFMGSGKSSVGKVAAKALGFHFVDTDQMIVERAGKPISEIFADEGEAAFRALESEVIECLSRVSKHVVSTGGGVVISSRNREALKKLGFVVCLTASEDVLFERVSRNTKRPLLQTENPRETLSNLFRERDILYFETAHWTLDTTEMSQAETVNELTAAAKEAFAWTRNH